MSLIPSYADTASQFDPSGSYSNGAGNSRIYDSGDIVGGGYDDAMSYDPAMLDSELPENVSPLKTSDLSRSQLERLVARLPGNRRFGSSVVSEPSAPQNKTLPALATRDELAAQMQQQAWAREDQQAIGAAPGSVARTVSVPDKSSGAMGMDISTGPPKTKDNTIFSYSQDAPKSHDEYNPAYLRGDPEVLKAYADLNRAVRPQGGGNNNGLIESVIRVANERTASEMEALQTASKSDPKALLNPDGTRITAQQIFEKHYHALLTTVAPNMNGGPASGNTNTVQGLGGAGSGAILPWSNNGRAVAPVQSGSGVGQAITGTIMPPGSGATITNAGSGSSNAPAKTTDRSIGGKTYRMADEQWAEFRNAKTRSEQEKILSNAKQVQ